MKNVYRDIHTITRKYDALSCYISHPERNCIKYLLYTKINNPYYILKYFIVNYFLNIYVLIHKSVYYKSYPLWLLS